MRLTGSVDPRGLLSLLALLDDVAASGTLRVSNDETHAALALVRGDVVVFEEALRRPTRLADLLPSALSAPRRKELKKALALAEGGGALGIAVEGGFATIEGVREGMARLIDEELFELFTWTEIHLRFESTDPAPLERAVEQGRAFRLEAKAFRLAAGGRLEGWRALTQRFSTPKLILGVRPGKAWLVEELMQSEELPGKALGFDGVRTLAEIVRSWRCPSYMAYRFVRDLLDQDLLDPLPADGMIKAFADAQLDDDGRSFRYYEAIVESGLAVGDAVLDRRLLGALDGARGGGRLSIRCSGRRALTLLIELCRSRSEVEVCVTAARTRRVFSVHEGALRFASSAPATGAVAEYLVRRGSLTRSRLKRARAERRQAGASLSQVLIASFGVTPAQWVEALCERVLDELAEVFFLRSTFCELRSPPSGRGPRRARAHVPLDTEGFAGAFKEGLSELEALLVGLPSARTLLERTEVEGDGRGLTLLFDGRQTLADMHRTLQSGQRELLRFVQRAQGAGRLRVIDGVGLRARAERALDGGRLGEVTELALGALEAGYQPRSAFEELAQAAANATQQAPGRSLLEGEAGGVNLAALVQHLHGRRRTGTLTLGRGDGRDPGKGDSVGAGNLALYLIEGQLWVLPASAVQAGEPVFLRLAQLREGGRLNDRRLPARLKSAVYEALARRVAFGARFRFEEGRLPRGLEEGEDVLAVELDTAGFLFTLCERLASYQPKPWRAGQDEQE